MKKLFLLMFLIGVFVNTNAQKKTFRKVVPILTNENFYLNGGLRAAFGGRSRVYYRIDLPPNTVEWYYVFTTSKNTNQPSINLVGQITKLLIPGNPMSLIASSLLVPSGACLADVFILDRQNLQVFINKGDQHGQRLSYVESGSRQNYTHGIVRVTDAVVGSWYLGIRNPTAYDGVNVSLEVAAIVENIN